MSLHIPSSSPAISSLFLCLCEKISKSFIGVRYFCTPNRLESDNLVIIAIGCVSFGWVLSSGI